MGYGANIEKISAYKQGGFRMSFLKMIAEVFGMTYDEKVMAAIAEEEE